SEIMQPFSYIVNWFLAPPCCYPKTGQTRAAHRLPKLRASLPNARKGAILGPFRAPCKRYAQA
ncbi:MAG: hypothetical protein ACTHJZ_08590, partial [Trinickia sp.]|uniref:hypothetical protein n=1 Tax=Trinickia sp. TaxID=2571163 RepID=UPI003F7FA14F